MHNLRGLVDKLPGSSNHQHRGSLPGAGTEATKMATCMSMQGMELWALTIPSRTTSCWPVRARLKNHPLPCQDCLMKAKVTETDLDP